MNRTDVPIWFFPTVIVTALSDNNMTHFLLESFYGGVLQGYYVNVLINIIITLHF